ncbi:MAG: pyruvate ferredoxin oxidoreductase [Prevotella sp.]|nr:pyruvate ferredoxin oxidoreductase [Prevotella sp.]
MDYKYIEQLLDRYFQGETTLQEEQILKAFYAQGTADMPQELGQYAALFEVLTDRETLGDDFDERMTRLVEGTDVKPATVKARTISLTERLRPLFGAAAVVAILLTLGNAINQSFKQDDTWVDAEEYAQRGAKPANGEPAVAYEQSTDSLTAIKDGLNATVETDSLRGPDIQ